MILPRLFNHGILRSIKKENNKLVLEGTTGKVEFEDSGLPSIGESDAGKVLMVDGGEAKWLWQLPPGSAGQFLKRTGTGQNFAFGDINQVPTGGTTGQVLKKTSDGYGWGDASGGGATGNYIEFMGTLSDAIDTTQDRVTITSSSFEDFDFTSVTGSPSAGAPVQLSLTISDSNSNQLITYLTGMWLDDDDVHCTVSGVGTFSSSPAHIYAITMQFVYDSGQITLDGLYDLILLEKIN